MIGNFTPKQLVTLAVMDVLMLVELIACFWLAYQDPENMVQVFLKHYAPLFLVTFIGGTLIARRFRSREAAPAPESWQV